MLKFGRFALSWLYMDTSATAPSPAQGNIPSLPKGGGAIRSVGEKFQANPATGTASFSIPLPFSQARALTPQIGLQYDSGAGNGAFGLGWGLSQSHISRLTDKGLPTYDNLTDRFALGGAELVLKLQNGAPVERVFEAAERSYKVRQYRTRIESGFNRIELWQDLQTGLCHWRVWSAANGVSIFGQQANARIANPEYRSRVFSWKIDRVFDQQGNLTLFEYRRDDDLGITANDAVEGPRFGQGQAQTYLHRILYGNRTPFSGALPDAQDFCFQTRFDYGETEALTAGESPKDWPVRKDAFSNYKPGFELRTRRMCTRVITEHRFPEIGATPECVSSLEISYTEGTAGQALLATAQVAGYTREDQASAYHVDRLPPLTFTYTKAELNTGIKPVRDETGQPVVGLGTARQRWVDLEGTALPGLLTEAAGAFYFQESLGDGLLGEARVMAMQPSLSGLGTTLEISDRQGRGRKQILASGSGFSGLYRRDAPEGIAPFRALHTRINIQENDPDLRAIDLTGDGLADRLHTNGSHLVWYRATLDGGFDRAQRVAIPVDAQATAEFLFSDPSGLTFLADMSGDGLVDIVRIAPRGVRYWPNLGFGRFGKPVEMYAAPRLGEGVGLNPDQMRLADVTGNGLTDIVWLGAQGVTLWENCAGNRFSAPIELGAVLPDGVQANAVEVTDILGQGTACLSWTGQHATTGAGQRLFVDLFNGVKADLLARVENGFGGVTELAYRPSTSYMREAANAGSPWVTRLHFPVHCLASSRVSDQVTGYSMASSYGYHHGYYDPDDREFRGFARVDQFDTETVQETGAQNQPRAFFQPTTLTRTWFHTGARLGNTTLEARLAEEYYQSDRLPLAPLLPELPEGLSPFEWAEAQRALKGTPLRSETYALDDSDKSGHPYTVEFGQFHLRLLQPEAPHIGRGVPPVFQQLQRQKVSVQLDRNPEDPRVSQSIVLEWTAWGMPLRQASILHGRWGAADTDTPAVLAEAQRKPVVAVSEQAYTAMRDPESQPTPNSLLAQSIARRLPVGFATTSQEVRGVAFPAWTLAHPTALATEIDALPALLFTDDTSPRGQRRLAESRSYFCSDDLHRALPLGETTALGIVHHTEVLAFTQDCLQALYGEDISDATLRNSGYVTPDDRSDEWWAPSGTVLYGDDPDSRFFLPIGARDPFGNDSSSRFDPHFLTPIESTDPVGNRSRVIIDYRRLAPVLSQDANENWSVVALNGLGQPLAMAAMGKVQGGSDPRTGNEVCEGSTLDRPSISYAYDLFAWSEERGPANVQQTTFEDHGSQNAQPRVTLESYDYTDGLGNLLMSKVQQAPGPAQKPKADGTLEEVDTARQSPPALRWLGNGRTILNNKGQPLRQFEPYFSVTPAFETEAELVEQGLSDFMFYDAAGRRIGQLSPDGSWVKTKHTPWRLESWDMADTCLLDPLADSELAAHFQGLPLALYRESWVDRRINGARGEAEKRAAEASSAHAETPSVSHMDTQGRPVVVQADSGEHGMIVTTTVLDIEGNTQAVVDDLGRRVVTHRFNLLPAPDEDNPKPALMQSSIDQGDSWSYFDCMGRAEMSRDAMGRRHRMHFDATSRPIEAWLQPKTGPERRIALNIYGENASEAAKNNLRAVLWQNFDSAGWAQTDQIDFLGNVLATRSRLLAGVEDSPHWPETPPARAALLAPEVVQSETAFDALSRPVQTILPYTNSSAGNVQYLGYDRGGELEWVDAQAVGGPRQRYVERLTYDAKGQRQLVRYGNGVETRYHYDPESQRLTRLVSENSAGERLQELAYSYDILGNITALRDSTQPDIFNGNARIEPVAHYRYDAVSRLIEASGREHGGQMGAPDWQNGLSASGQINDFQRLRPYSQFYAYDSTGNILSMRHVANGNNWTRHYGYSTENHQLAWTNIGRHSSEGADLFTYNAAGSMLSLPHLGAFALNIAEQMVEVDLGGGGRAYYTYNGAGERVRKRVERVGDIVEERLYFGALEIYRKWVGGTLRLRRETQHIADDSGIIALIETRTHDENGEISAPAPLARYQLTTHQGSAALELDAQGDVLTREEYHPYGTTAFFASAQGRALPPKRYRYTGQERDEETGLQYHNARFYAPWLARWTTADPIGIGDGLNVYGYVGGRPIGSVDPSGNSEFYVSPNQAAALAKHRLEQLGIARATLAAEQRAAAQLVEELSAAAQQGKNLRGAKLLRHLKQTEPLYERTAAFLEGRAVASATAEATAARAASTRLGFGTLFILVTLPTIEFVDGANLTRLREKQRKEASQKEVKILYNEHDPIELTIEDVFESKRVLQGDQAIEYQGAYLTEKGALEHALYETLPQEAGVYVIEDVVNRIAYVGSSGDTTISRFLSAGHLKASDLLYDSGAIRISIYIPNADLGSNGLFIRMLEQAQIDATAARNPHMLNARNEMNIYDYAVSIELLEDAYDAGIMDLVSEIHTVDITVR